MEELDKNFRESTERNEQWLSAIRSQANQTPSVYNQLREIQARERIDGINKRIHAQDSIESAIAVTPPGGSLSPALVEALNVDKGIEPGKSVVDGQIMEGGYNPKTGGYGFVVARANCVPRIYLEGRVPHSLA